MAKDDRTIASLTKATVTAQPAAEASESAAMEFYDSSPKFLI